MLTSLKTFICVCVGVEASAGSSGHSILRKYAHRGCDNYLKWIGRWEYAKIFVISTQSCCMYWMINMQNRTACETLHNWRYILLVPVVELLHCQEGPVVCK